MGDKQPPLPARHRGSPPPRSTATADCGPTPRRALNAVQTVRRSRRGLAQVSRSGVAGVRSGGQPPAAGQWREGLGGSGQGDGGSGGCGLCGEGGDGSLGRRRWIQRQPATETITLPVTCKSSAAR